MLEQQGHAMCLRDERSATIRELAQFPKPVAGQLSNAGIVVPGDQQAMTYNKRADVGKKQEMG